MRISDWSSDVCSSDLLVEASPYDRIWGAGLAASDARITDPTKWPGLNLLGQVLDRVRERLIDAELSNNALTRQIHHVHTEDEEPSQYVLDRKSTRLNSSH